MWFIQFFSSYYLYDEDFFSKYIIGWSEIINQLTKKKMNEMGVGMRIYYLQHMHIEK